MSNTWNYITPMGTRRSCLGIAAFDGLVSYFIKLLLYKLNKYYTVESITKSALPNGLVQNNLLRHSNSILYLTGFSTATHIEVA